MKRIVLDAQGIGTGSLILVNRDHPLRGGEAERENRLVALEDECGREEGIRLESRAAALLTGLLKTVGTKNPSGAAAGCERILPVDGYRSFQEQQHLFAVSIKENGEAFTKRYVAVPDCSEHQTGLAVDMARWKKAIDPIRPEFGRDGLCGRFRAEAARFGFVERYRKEKERLTGIAAEEWHFRYVGYPHARLMEEDHLCLEEYLLYLKEFSYDAQSGENRHLHLWENGWETEIFYVKMEGRVRQIPVADRDRIRISGNNVDGYVVTLSRERG